MRTLIKAFGLKALHCRNGGVALHVGLLASSVVGMAGLGTEMTYLSYKHRQMQVVADAAALSAAAAAQGGANARIEAQAIAAQLGFADGVANASITVNTPPVSGPHISDDSAHEVIVSQPQTMTLAALFHSKVFAVRTRAVALQGNQAPICILALDPSASESIEIGENAAVTSQSCGIASNSRSHSALKLESNSYTNGPVSVVGNWSLSSSAHLYGSPKKNHAGKVDDPYQNVQVLTPPTCTSQSLRYQIINNQKVVNLNPGHFCNGWEFESNVIVNLAPGAYYVDAKMDIANGATLNGTGGVTIILNTNYDMEIEDGATVNINAPASGNYAGIAFMARRDGCPDKEREFGDRIKLNVNGAIYFPNQEVKFENVGVTGTAGCMQIIARKVELEHNVYMDNTGCANYGVTQMHTKQTQLVE